MLLSRTSAGVGGGCSPAAITEICSRGSLMFRNVTPKSFGVVLWFFAVFVAPACTPAHHCPTSYDVLGPYTVPLGGNLGEMSRKLRSFIWMHWHERRRGCAEVTTTDMFEGVRCTNIYTVEADTDGRWRVLDEWECGRGARGLPRPTTGTSAWYSVQRVPEGGAGWRRGKPVPESADVPPDSYILVFQDRSGRTKSPL